MNIKYKKLALVSIGAVTFALTSISIVNAAGAELPAGLQIAERINARDEGQMVSRNLTMEMIDRRGKKRVRETRGFRKYFSGENGEEKRTVIFYLAPKNIKETAFLTFDYPQAKKDDDQWLYLPAMRKVRRISASDRGDYFLGTDFTYEDIKKETKVTIEDYNRKTLREDNIDGHRVYVVESTPVSDEIAEELGYSKVIQWVDAEIWIVRKADFWDVRGNSLKTIHSTEISQVQGIWTTHRLEVVNHKTKHQTVFTFSEVDYQSPVKDSLFTKRTLRRGL
ncbi:MAG: outer membrane lipoprotein-sorting protein [Gammaproteobacteria bacterium]|nr:outer membrane lipoprotein-sorting protein [Gammaproteobacteria bacterium]